MASKHIRSEIATGAGITKGALEVRPPFGVQQDLFTQPVRDGLLCNGGVSGLTQTSSEIALLAAGKFDSALERSNVRFLHTAQPTRILVNVNKDLCFPTDKGPCTVLTFPSAQGNAMPNRAKKKQADLTPTDVGADGLTLRQRLFMLMEERNIGQTELARLCSEYYATFVPAVQDKVKQQHIWNILQGQQSSEALPIIAAVLDVSDLWLQYGIGRRQRK